MLIILNISLVPKFNCRRLSMEELLYAVIAHLTSFFFLVIEKAMLKALLAWGDHMLYICYIFHKAAE